MAALDFPDTPAVGDPYGSSGTVWRWDGARWASTAGASGARGRVAYAQAVANQTGIVAQTQVLTCSFVADPARTYRTSWFAGAYSTVTGDWALFKVTDAAGVQKQLQVPPILSNTYGQQVEGSLVETGLSGTTTRRLTLERLAGTGNIAFNAGASQPAFILVEDITYEAGSSGSPPAYISPQFRRFSGTGASLAAGAATYLGYQDNVNDNVGNIGNRAAGYFSMGEKGLYSVDATLTWGSSFGSVLYVIDLCYSENQGGTIFSLGTQALGPTPWGTTHNTFTIDHTAANVTAAREYLLRIWNYSTVASVPTYSVRVARVSTRP